MNKQTTEERKALFAWNLRHAIEAKKVSIKHVADVTGVSYDRLRRWSTEGLSRPSGKTEEALHKLSKYFFPVGGSPHLFWRTSEIEQDSKEKEMLYMLDRLQNKALRDPYVDYAMKKVREEIQRLYAEHCGSLSMLFEVNTFSDKERY